MSDPAPDPPPQFMTVGDNPARAFGMGARERAEALAREAGLDPGAATVAGRGTVLADLDFAWDPAWVRAIARQPGAALVRDGRAVLVHVPAGTDPAPVAAAMRDGAAVNLAGYQLHDGDRAEPSGQAGRKRQWRFVLPLVAGQEEAVERAAFDAAYRTVGDAVTLFVWRRPAFALTRAAARAGVSPMVVTLAGFLLCVLAFVLYWYGRYWEGCAAGFGVMLLDTVDGKLARCTGQSFHWGKVVAQGIDLVHPPFWWWAWAQGLGRHGPLRSVGFAGLEPVYEALLIGAIVGGDVAIRVIEQIFVRRFGMQIHRWRPVDGKFRLISARRNINMVILLGSLVIGRPDIGLQWVALWTLVSLIFHAVRLAMANGRADRGRQIIGWLS